MRTFGVLLLGAALSLALDFSEVDVGLHNERGWVAAYADFNADKANDLLVVRDSGAGVVCSLPLFGAVRCCLNSSPSLPTGHETHVLLWQGGGFVPSGLALTR